MKHLRIAAAAALTFGFAALPAMAEDLPVEPGDYVEISSITVDDGHTLDYINHLAGQWRKGQDYAKAQGWISSYEILSNEYPRAGEPDFYLVTRFPRFADPAEGKKRDDMYNAYMQSTMAQAQAASADRAKYRHLSGSMLLRSWNWAKK